MLRVSIGLFKGLVVAQDLLQNGRSRQKLLSRRISLGLVSLRRNARERKLMRTASCIF